VIHTVLDANRAARAGAEPRGFLGIRRRPGFGRPGRDTGQTELAGLVLTGGYRPRKRDLEALQQEGMFAYLVEQDTYEAASRVHDLLVKTHPADREKIELIKQLVADHLDVDRVLERFAEPGLRAVLPRTPLGRPTTGLVKSMRAGLRRLGRRVAGSR
jgi:hypothetical protein